MYIRLTEGPAYHCIRHNSRPKVTRTCSLKKRHSSSVAVAAIGSLAASPPSTPPPLLLLLLPLMLLLVLLLLYLNCCGYVRMTGGSIDCRPS